MLKKPFLILIGLIGLTSVCWAGWYTNTANQTNVWLYRQMITVNHASVSAALTDFPVLVKITGTSNPLFSKAQSTGNDIRFTQADGSTKITHEVEYYNSTTGTLCAWVRVPALSNTVDTNIYMYYGCANAASVTAEASNTWDPNFIMVHHLAQTSGHHLDSTASANNSTLEALTAQGTQVGTIDGADTFNGTSDHVITTTTNATISAGSICILANETATAKTYMSGCYNGAYLNRLYLYDSAEVFWIDFSGLDISSTFTIPLNTWHYYALTWSSTTAYIVYVDGVAKASGTAATALTAIPPSNYLGAYPDNSKWWTGKIDEFRWSKTQRSAAWLLTEWNNMSSPSTFITLATEGKRPSAMMSNAVPPPLDKRRKQYARRFNGNSSYD
jgi:Concanavalin A-like lectin/glucanases superfamily/Domain of unknown function (DUF2341)